MSLQPFDVSEHTAAPLRIVIEERFSVSAEFLFQAFTDPHLMCRTFPWMSAVTVEGNGVGAIRRCHFGNGLILEEEIVGWWPEYGYAFRGIDHNHPFGMRGHLGHVWCEPSDNGSQLTWKQYFDHSNPVAMLEKLRESMCGAIENLRSGEQ